MAGLWELQTHTAQDGERMGALSGNGSCSGTSNFSQAQGVLPFFVVAQLWSNPDAL
jgi:hypothetical protein